MQSKSFFNVIKNPQCLVSPRSWEFKVLTDTRYGANTYATEWDDFRDKIFLIRETSSSSDLFWTLPIFIMSAQTNTAPPAEKMSVRNWWQGTGLENG